jgi:hypothetical protein
VPESIGDPLLAPFCLYGELYEEKDLPRGRLELLSTVDNMVPKAYIIGAGRERSVIWYFAGHQVDLLTIDPH